MGWFDRLRRNRQEERAVEFEDALLQSLLGGGTVTREMALQVPTVSGGIDLISNIIAETPIKLYRDSGKKTDEMRDDPRIRLLNDETGDTLNANEFWRAMIRDYYLGKGGYAYIHREKGKIHSLHYVSEAEIAVQKNSDPIFKDFDILVQEKRYQPFDFLKILRNTKDGATGTPITEENSKLIETAYTALVFERNMAKRGGNKKGFLKSEKRLDSASLEALRTAFLRLYGSDNDNFVVLNNGTDFKESQSTPMEMQLNENKLANAHEFAKIFHISTEAMGGKAEETSNLAKLAAIPLMVTIQCALNRDLLLEKEKGEYYFAFDTKELLKGDMKTRFDAYRTALDANFMQIDEVRYAEDLEPLGLNWIKLGLQDVLYDPKTERIYTPNTNQTSTMGEQKIDGLNVDADSGTMESRANPNHDPSNGRFTSGPGGGGARSAKKTKTKYAASPQRNHSGIQLKPKEYARLCGVLGTQYPNAPQDVPVVIRSAQYQYRVKPDGNGGMIVLSKSNLARGRKK